MSRARLFIVVIFGVLAFGVVTSSMASAGWMVNGTNFTSGTKALASTAAVDEAFILTAANAEITCAATTLKSTNPRINGGTNMADAESLEFGECKGNQVCPLGPNQGSAVKTLPSLTDVTLDEPNIFASRDRFLFSNESKLVATIEFSGAECAVKGVQPLKGDIEFLLPFGRLERTLQLVRALNEPGLEVGSTEARLKGSILIRLLSGEPFSFL